MKSPNASNIEQMLFSYFEGDLTASEENSVEQFLLDNPEFDKSFEAWGAARFVPEATHYPHINKIRKPFLPAGILHRAAAFTAIVLNIGLAALLLLNRTNEANYQSVQLKVTNESEANTSSINITNQSSVLNTQVNDVVEQIESDLDSKKKELIFGSEKFENDEYIAKRDAKRAVLPSFDPVTFDETVTDNENVMNNNVLLLSNESNQSTIIKETTLPDSGSSEENSNMQLTRAFESQNQAVLEVIIPSEETILAENVTNKISTSEGSQKNMEYANNSNGEKPNRDGGKKISFVNRFKQKGAIGLNNYRTPEYLVPGMNRNQINFGHVGSDLSNSVYLNNYIQRPNQGNSMTTSQLGYDMYLPRIKSGLGFQAMYNNYTNGAIQNFEVSVTYSPKIQLKKNIMIEPSARLKMGSTGVNRNALSPNSWMEYDRSNPFFYSTEQHTANVNTTIQQDLGLGFLVNSKLGYLGLNADNILGAQNHALHYQSELYGNRAPVFVNAVVGTEYESFNKKTLWSSHLVYQNHGMLNKFWFGSNIKYNYLSLGASISSAGEPMLNFGLVTNYLTLRYAADFSNSYALNRKTMSHQLSLRVLIKESRMKKMIIN